MRLAPGDPLAGSASDRPLTEPRSRRCAHRYRLDQPLQRSSLRSGGVVRGDLGVSIEYGRRCRQLLVERLPATLLLGGTVLLLNFTLGLWLGVRQARPPRQPRSIA